MPRPYLVPGPTICVGSHQQGIACSSFPRMNWAGAGLHAGGPLLLLPLTVVHPSSPPRGSYLSSWRCRCRHCYWCHRRYWHRSRHCTWPRCWQCSWLCCWRRCCWLSPAALPVDHQSRGDDLDPPVQPPNALAHSQVLAPIASMPACPPPCRAMPFRCCRSMWRPCQRATVLAPAPADPARPYPTTAAAAAVTAVISGGRCARPLLVPEQLRPVHPPAPKRRRHRHHRLPPDPPALQALPGLGCHVDQVTGVGDEPHGAGGHGEAAFRWARGGAQGEEVAVDGDTPGGPGRHGLLP